MYANTCWGFLSLAVTFGLAVLGVPPDYGWLQPYFIWSAVACGLISVFLFCWLAVRKMIRHPDGEGASIHGPHEPERVGNIKVKAGDGNKFGNIGHQLNPDKRNDNGRRR